MDTQPRVDYNKDIVLNTFNDVISGRKNNYCNPMGNNNDTGYNTISHIS